MNILIYANCQGGGIKKIIEYYNSGKLKFDIYHEINYMTIALNSKGESVDLPAEFSERISKADVIVFQPLSRKYGFFSTDRNVDGSVLTRCRAACIPISFPYVYNNALWPFVIEGGRVKLPASVLDEIREAGSEKDILRKYDSGSLKFSFYNRFEETMKILEERERECDVKVSSYIRKSITSHRLFLTQNHPTTRVFSDISSKIMKILCGNEDFLFDEEDFLRRTSDIPENLSELPGYHPIDDYALRHYEFSYMEKADHNAANYYKNLLAQIFHLAKSK